MTEDEVWNTLLRWHREVVNPDYRRTLEETLGALRRELAQRAAEQRQRHALWLEEVRKLHGRGPDAEPPHVR